MSNEDRYFAVLANAIAQVDTDSFEARGVIYDRLWEIVLRRLQDDSDASEEALANERKAFLAAIQRIELGERLPPAAEEPLPAVEEPVPVANEKPQVPKPDKQLKRAGRGRIARRMVAACVLLLVQSFGYLVARFEPASWERLISENPNDAWQARLTRVVHSVRQFFERQSPVALQGPRQRAVLYEENPAISSGSTYSGYAIWRGQGEAKGAATRVLSIDVEIPQKELILQLELRSAGDKSGVLSHLIEFRFLSAKGTLSEAVQDVLGVLMKTDELSPGAELIGKVARVRPGIFLMGLSGSSTDLERNVTLLKERPWLDIPIVFRGGTRSLLAIEKGTTGQNAVNELLRPGGQG